MNYDHAVELAKQYLPLVGQYGLMGLGALCVMGTAYIKATPTQDDDQWLQKLEEKPVIGAILCFLTKFAPIERKEEKPAEEEKK